MAEKVRVGKISNFQENQPIVVESDKGKIAVFHVGNDFYAISNACVHRGGSLGDGTVSGETVTCPLHAWEFDLETGKCLTTPGESVQKFKVTVENDEVFVEV